MFSRTLILEGMLTETVKIEASLPFIDFWGIMCINLSRLTYKSND